MVDSSVQCPLPPSVEELIKLICKEQMQPPPELQARKELASLPEVEAADILSKIRRVKITKSFTGFIIYMVRTSRDSSLQPSLHSPFINHTQGSTSLPEQESSSDSDGENDSDSMSMISYISDKLTSMRLKFFAGSKTLRPSPQFSALIWGFPGRRKLEDVASVRDIKSIVAESKTLSISSFEDFAWETYGKHYCNTEGRMRYHDWDSPGRHYFYNCHVQVDGSYAFKGLYLNSKTTLLHKVLNDENILIVNFVDDGMGKSSVNMASGTSFSALEKVAKEGIYFGSRWYQFFAFKDGGRSEKNNATTSSVKCYFVNLEAFSQSCGVDIKCPRKARSFFMHLDTLPSLSKYTSRLELILSKTVTLPVNLDGEDIHIEVIHDIPCQHRDGSIVEGDDGKPLVHTDGTGFISEHLVLRFPQNCSKAKFLNDCFFEGSVGNGSEVKELSSQSVELPLLMQFRMFHFGYAVKGTVLLNKKLPQGTIQVRPSMIKVCADHNFERSQTVNSFEVVAVSDRPKKSYLSKYLLALLHFGGVPEKFFMDILKKALADSQTSLTNTRAALQVSLALGEMDDSFTTARMILSGISLTEPYLATRLSFLTTMHNKSLKEGKLPIEESFYLMGTTDPTGSLNRNEVCIIHENGQLSGKVLVYRNPGIHFGDVHVLTAKHVDGLEEIVGNSKYAIFFPTQVSRSLADEMARGDFDGDMFWVSRNLELLKYFRQSDPWTCLNPSLSSSKQEKPSNFSDEELEHELFSRFLRARFQQSKVMGIASNSWLAHMDQLLAVRDNNSAESNLLKEKMLKLVDIYFDALDAPKTGKEVTIPRELIPKEYPHYMGRMSSYTSKSVLGAIYDEAHKWEFEATPSIPAVWKLPSLDVEVSHKNLRTWERHYNTYRAEMAAALSTEDQQAKRQSPENVIQKYRQILYEAEDLESSPREWEEIRADALAIYNISYNLAKEKQDPRKCAFPWRVACVPLLKIYVENQTEKPLACLPSVLQELLSRNNV